MCTESVGTSSFGIGIGPTVGVLAGYCSGLGPTGRVPWHIFMAPQAEHRLCEQSGGCQMIAGYYSKQADLSGFFFVFVLSREKLLSGFSILVI